MNAIETDYLVVGAGAAGMSFTDALINADRDCGIVMVDRRHAPGGHWNDAYPFAAARQRSTRRAWAERRAVRAGGWRADLPSTSGA